MIIPIRCFTCNKVIANKCETYEKLLQEGKNIEDIFKRIRITRYCCKRMFLSNYENED